MERAAQRSYVIHKSEQIAHNASILTLFRPAFLDLTVLEGGEGGEGDRFAPTLGCNPLTIGTFRVKK